jgi:negative regulator of PHO system
MWQLLKGLLYCHNNGLMHRNLKPDNILVSSKGIVKLGDFTLSRIALQKDNAYTPEDPKE